MARQPLRDILNRQHRFQGFARLNRASAEGIDPHFHTCKKFVHAKAFVQESSAAFRNGNLVYIPSCSPLDMDRVKKTVKNYYRIHEYEPNLDFLHECRQNIDKKYKSVIRLQDAFYAVAMESFAKKFEALNEKFCKLEGNNMQVSSEIPH